MEMIMHGKAKLTCCQAGVGVRLQRENHSLGKGLKMTGSDQYLSQLPSPLYLSYPTMESLGLRAIMKKR